MAAPGVVPTDPVFIDSSPINIAGLLKSRVIKRKDNYYMLPRSPTSPTPNMRVKKSGTQTSARVRKNFVQTNVSKLKVDPIQVYHTLWGRNVPPTQNIDLKKATSFNPSVRYVTSFSQLHSLDMLPAKGLAEKDFWTLFSKCESCHHLMTTRTVPYHVCPPPGTKFGLKVGTDLNNILQNRAQFMWLLDAHNSDHAAGVPENVFKSIFYLCKQCGRYMTQRVSRDHHEEELESGDYRTGCINLKLTTDSNREKRFRLVAQEFPMSPLSK